MIGVVFAKILSYLSSDFGMETSPGNAQNLPMKLSPGFTLKSKEKYLTDIANISNQNQNSHILNHVDYTK